MNYISEERNIITKINGKIRLLSMKSLHEQIKAGIKLKDIFALSYNHDSGETEWKQVKAFHVSASDNLKMYRTKNGITCSTEKPFTGNYFVKPLRPELFDLEVNLKDYLNENDLKEVDQNSLFLDNEKIERVLKTYLKIISGQGFNFLRFSESDKVLFKILCTDNCLIKFPDFIYNISLIKANKFLEKFFAFMENATILEHKFNEKPSYQYRVSNINLISGLSYLFDSLCLRNNVRINKPSNDKKCFDYLIRTKTNSNGRTKKQEIFDIEGNHIVYSLTVEDNNNFVDAMGRVLIQN